MQHVRRRSDVPDDSLDADDFHKNPLRVNDDDELWELQINSDTCSHEDAAALGHHDAPVLVGGFNPFQKY